MELKVFPIQTMMIKDTGGDYLKMPRIFIQNKEGSENQPEAKAAVPHETTETISSQEGTVKIVEREINLSLLNDKLNYLTAVVEELYEKVLSKK